MDLQAESVVDFLGSPVQVSTRPGKIQALSVVLLGEQLILILQGERTVEDNIHYGQQKILVLKMRRERLRWEAGKVPDPGRECWVCRPACAG